MKGQAAEHLPGIVKIMADVAAGGNTKKLFKMMEGGQLDPNKYLPLLFEELNARSAGGWSKYTQSIQYQQNMASKRFEDAMKLFGASGGNDAFFRMWRAFADGLPKMDGLVKGLAGAFGMLADTVESVMRVLGGISDLFKLIQSQSEGTKASFAILGAAILAWLNPVKAALVGIYLLIDDIVAYKNNEPSLIGEAFGEDRSQVPDKFQTKVNEKTFREEWADKVARMRSGLPPASDSQYEWMAAKTTAKEVIERNKVITENIQMSQRGLPYLAPNLFSTTGEGGTIKIDNVNIHTTTNDPTEHAKKFSETLENTLIKFPKKEGN